MSSVPTAQYFLLTTGLSRGQDDATAKKKVCTWWKEYFRLDGEFGTLTSVNEMEDGLMWFSVGAQLPVPARAVPSTAAAYDAAYRRYQAKAKAQRKAEDKAKAFRKQLASGDIYGLRAEAQEAEPTFIEMLNEVSVQLHPERSEASIPPPGLLDDITVLDTEFVPEGAHLLEIAAIRYINGEAQQAFVSFVRYDGIVPRFVSELTGITALHVYGPTIPSEKKVLQQFFQYAGDSLLVAHNVAADRGIIEKTRTRLGAPAELPNAWLCTMALARKRLPKGQKVALAELCQLFNIKRRGAHRAKADVEMTVQLLRKLHEQQPVTKGDLHGAPQPGKGRKISTPTGPGLFAAA